ncbi:MAG: hypothetical protein IPJ34_14470 [Myxococcales bacterium]|nr:hypothetical protein [Myxococcales bacterium]
MPQQVRRKRPWTPRLPPGDDVTLQLAIGRELGVGLELSGPLALGPALLLHARSRLLGVGFPLDVSGGVERFRHRRTALDAAEIALDHGPAERLLSSLAGDLVAPGPAEVRLAWPAPVLPDSDPTDAPHDLRVFVTSAVVRGDGAIDPAIVAADLSVGAVGTGLTITAHRLRGLGLGRSPLVVIGALMARLAHRVGGRAHGLVLTLPDPLRDALTEAFATRGARVPRREEVVITHVSRDAERLRVRFSRGVPLDPSRAATSLAEVGRMVGDADAAFVAGDEDRARSGYLAAIERAPRHRAILGRLAELDAYASRERAEAAMFWLRESHAAAQQERRGDDGNALGRQLLLAWLHERLGARSRARSAFQRAGAEAEDRGESRLAARAYDRAAALLGPDDPELASLLDRALGNDPTQNTARWRRLALRARIGDDGGAMEDIQHLEAQARGEQARKATLLRAARTFHEAGRLEHAVPAYERALKYAPDDRDTCAGLGAALLAAREVGRGVMLLGKAADLAGDGAVTLVLARALAGPVGDAPAAIARLREISGDDPHAAHARLLEAAYRLRLGDRPGASRALGFGLELLEARPPHGDDRKPLVELLLGAAIAVREDDPGLGLRAALAGLALDPQHQNLATLVQALGRGRSEDDDEEPPATDPGRDGHGPLPSIPPPRMLLEDLPLAEDDDAEAQAESLLARVKANPEDDAAIDALVDVLGRLGRDFELFALLAARWDDADAEQRRVLRPRQEAVLRRMAEAAERDGRVAEGQVYRDAIARL